VKRHGVIAAILWLVVSVVAEIALWNLSIFPAQGAREAVVADDAFRVLIRLSIPVFALVLVMLVYSIVRFRSRGRPVAPGSYVWTDRRVVLTWVVVTSVLAVVLIVNPGLTGLADIRGSSRADLVVRMSAKQWEWKVTYPSFADASSFDEMVLPVGERIRFEVVSFDVIHAFWVPAFRIKIDAVPGRTNVVYATPTQIASWTQDYNLRVQCAELCGLGHASMNLPIRVVSPEEFEQWVSTLRHPEPGEGPPPTPGPGGDTP
jgi:cytochrome c oxidase subunit 2